LYYIIDLYQLNDNKKIMTNIQLYQETLYIIRSILDWSQIWYSN